MVTPAAVASAMRSSRTRHWSGLSGLWATEIEIGLPDRYRLSPQIAAAMRAVPGVVEVELV